MSQNVVRFLAELDIDEEKWHATRPVCGERWEIQDGETDTDFIDSLVLHIGTCGM
ncbi:MAG: hypothetical protein M1294_13530 [Firmicutes bacterium]|jgi:hypothetical protein|nr:hypothetical protein [Bacillota bacterium]MCL5014926.1 hypothetical protein [Bacillota bacterium]